MSAEQEWKSRIEEAAKKLNLKWYTNDDQYSDGDVEEDIVRIIAMNEPEDYDKAIYEHFDWPIYFHLTNVRQNLLNWYPFKEGSSVLEIGSGCGALTGLLCDKCGKVTAVELSKRRALATQLRCREKDNLRVIVGNLNDITFEEKFDYITLIGVLEYQGAYTNSDNPYRDFLVKIKSLLNAGGKLLIGIENKYGVKYWCGAVEDHTGIPFDSMNQYRLSNQKVRTFAKAELEKLIKKSGYANPFFYYPMPDYKLPTVIYSEKYMPRNENMEFVRPYYIPSDQTLVVDEKGLYRDIIKNGAFDFFANSFLVECSYDICRKGEPEDEKAIFALLNSMREKAYRIGTRIMDSGEVVKFVLENNGEAYSWLSQILDNTARIQERGLNILPYHVNGKDELEMEFVEFPVFEDAFRDAVSRKDMDGIWRLWNKLLEEIEISSDSAEQSECMIYELGLDEYRGEGEKYGKILKEGYLDMLPKNCFVNRDGLLWFDQEWVLENVPAKFVLYRGMVETYTSISDFKKIIPTTEFIRHYEMEKYLDVFMSLNEIFLQMVRNPYYVGNLAENNDKYIFRKNVLRLI